MRLSSLLAALTFLTACPGPDPVPPADAGIDAGTDAGSEPTPTCTDGVKNGDETGVDCGGSCSPCELPPSCTDGVKNGNETDKDCGGSCGKCELRKSCLVGADCASGICSANGVCVECVEATTCPGTDSECSTRTCVDGVCGRSFATAGTVVAAQTAGDCQVAQCDGAGNIQLVPDETDVPVDGNECTEDLCIEGVPSNLPSAAGTACTTGGSMCNGAGACVQCLAATDCPGTDSECGVRTCTAGVCGMEFAAAGTPLPQQTAGDCQVAQCDGAGNVQMVPDNADLPVDGNECTDDVCTAGVPSNPPRAAGTACTAGGSMCNGAGACVQCLAATDCPGIDTACGARTCTAGVCGMEFAAAGTPLPQQTAGDCQVAQCDGAGKIQMVADNADLPVDGNECTDDVCTAGVPSNPPSAAGTACSTGGSMCNGAGACVQCLAATDCPGTDTACGARTCTAGVCGMELAAAGTATAQQTPGDCHRTVCDGAGAVVSVIDDTDVPVDANDCTANVCTNGVPSNPNSMFGTACSTNGGNVCDGQGGCIRSVMVVRVGDGTAALTSAAAAVFIEERTETGVLLGGNNPLPLPTAANGANQPFTLSGTATTEGALSSSADGAYVVLAGYAAAPGTANVSGTASSATNRVIARIDASRNVDTSTRLSSAFSANSVRAATSDDGLSFWVSGNGGSNGGIHYVSLGSTGASTQILSSPANVRWIHIYGGQLYATAASGTFQSVFSVGTGLPTMPPQTATILPGLPTASAQPYAFVMFDRDSAVAGLDTLYIADDRSPPNGGIQKWTFNGTTWTLAATLNSGISTGVRGLTGYESATGVVLFATTAENPPNRLVRVVDDGTTSPVFTVVSTAAPNTAYRGVALSPH